MKDLIQKKVKIIGLSINKNLGILKACQLNFDNNNRLTTFKGEVGAGKSTAQTALKLGVQGTKTLTDKNMFQSEIDCETQLMDGNTPVYVGCKTNQKGDLIYTLYTKDVNGKIVRDPIIDGVKATPSKYLEALQTELTWRMNELTSDNPTVQRNILLKLYQSDFIKHDVIFDSKHPEYKSSILGQIDAAIKVRDEKDMIRKQIGGIAEDLKVKGFDPDRPDSIPDYVDIISYEYEIKRLEKEKTTKEVEARNSKEKLIANINLEGQKLKNESLSINQREKVLYEERKEEAKVFNDLQDLKKSNIENALSLLGNLVALGYSGKEVSQWISELPRPENKKYEQEPEYITFDSEGRIEKAPQEILDRRNTLYQLYEEAINSNEIVDLSEYDTQFALLDEKIKLAEETNKIVKAVDSFHAWRKANEDVLKLKNEYIQLLSKVDTGVKGLSIVPEDNGDIFLMYDGSYDPTYFNNPEKELRKLSSYSGTQKPIICLLIQNYLLSKKPKALRYLFIDNIPIDNKTRLLLEDICEKLDLCIFLNITGDFEKDSLKDGEILIEGGEVFFN